MTKLLMNGRELRHAEIDFAAGDDAILLADGTLWSHAATLGGIVYAGEPVDINRAVVENFVKVFADGYPKKVPVDYEHASTTDDPEIRKLRAQGKVPKAGDVAEFKGVFSAADFTGDLKAAAEKLSAKASRPLDDPRNLGLWMRWKPTAQALAAIKADEYTELSIAFDTNWPNKATGEGQGPTILAVGLVSRPFLDEMLSVAASSDHGRSPAAPGSREGEMSKLTVLSVAAAVLGKATFASEDDALNELNALGPQLKEFGVFREFREILSAEFENEKDPAKVVAKVRELRAQLKTAQDAAAEQKKQGIATTVTATIKQFENAIGNKALRTMLERNLTAELEAGKELEKTETMAALKELKPARQFSQSSAADIGGTGVSADQKIAARADELLETDPSLKAMASRDFSTAYKQASARAMRELQAN